MVVKTTCEYKNFRKQNVRHHQKTNHPNEKYRVISFDCEHSQNDIDHKAFHKDVECRILGIAMLSSSENCAYQLIKRAETVLILFLV